LVRDSESVIPYDERQPDRLVLRGSAANALQSGKMMPSHSRSTGSPEDQPRSRLRLTDFTVTTPDSKARPSASEAQPSRWRSKEFIFYGLALVLVLPVMIYWPTRLSTRESIVCIIEVAARPTADELSFTSKLGRLLAPSESRLALWATSRKLDSRVTLQYT
jgi:hypothetical protein